MRADSQIWIVTVCVFFAVSSWAALAGLYFARYRKTQRRLLKETFPVSSPKRFQKVASEIASKFDEKSLGLSDEGKRAKLRSELVRAGYFSTEASTLFVLSKIVLALFFPVLAYAVLTLSVPVMLAGLKASIMGVAGYLGYLTPDIFVARRRQRLAIDYRVAFPDFLDLLIVCVDAGLSMNAALDRVSQEFGKQSPAFAKNLGITLSEVRSGRGFSQALEKLSDRMGIEEAKSFSALIKQSLELGTDVAEAMRIFADEMRQKRLLKAEERANTLSVRMLLPLGLFVFPVLFIVLMTPAIIRIIGVFRQMQLG